MPVDNIIFLDVDGVLHPSIAAGADALGETMLQPQLMLLKEIFDSVEGVAKIVITSNWRKYPPLKRLLEAELISIGIASGIHDCTEVIKNNRQSEICKWLQNYGPTKFVIIDDIPLTSGDVQTGDRCLTCVVPFSDALQIRCGMTLESTDTSFKLITPSD